MNRVLRYVVILLLGLGLGWWLRWLVDTDSCYDAGGVWEPHGSYCYGARNAHPGDEASHAKPL